MGLNPQYVVAPSGLLVPAIGDAAGRQFVLSVIGSGAVSTTNPEPVVSQIQAMILAGQGYQATTGLIATGAANAFVGMELLCNNLTKNVLVYSVFVANQNIAGDIELRQAATNTQDAALTAPLTPLNQQPGGAASVASATGSPAATTQTGGLVGTLREQASSVANANYEMLTNGSLIFIAKATTGLVATYVKIPTSGNIAAITMAWVEF